MSKDKLSETAYDAYRKDRHSFFLTHRNNLDERAFKTSERYDQWVITLSGGALGISLTVLEKVSPHPDPCALVLLGCSWCALICSVLSAFGAIYCSRLAIYRAIRIADEQYRFFETTTTKENPVGEDRQESENIPSIVVNWLNIASISCLIVGVILMCAFALMNLHHSSKPITEQMAAPTLGRDTVQMTNLVVNTTVTQAIQIPTGNSNNISINSNMSKGTP